MARMLHDRESTDKHLNASRRHMRLCKHVKGTEKYVVALQPLCDQLVEKQTITTQKIESRQDAYDDVILFDIDLDNGVRTTFEKSKQFDREHPGEAVLIKIFPEEKYSLITNVARTKEPNIVEQVAVRIENLGESHELYSLAAYLLEKITASRTAIDAYHAAIRQQKIAEAEEEIAQANVRQQYENNYLNARKDFGRTVSERLFPRVSASATQEQAEEPGERG